MLIYFRFERKYTVLIAFIVGSQYMKTMQEALH